MSETQALARTEPQLPPAPATPDFDQAAALAALGFSVADVMKPSKLALVQPIEVDEENGKVAGTFMDVKSKQKFRKMRIAVLYIGGDDPGSLNGKVCFTPGGDLGSKPLCRSRNGVLPVINDELVRQDGGLGCKKCPKAQWKKIGGKNIKPQCGDTIKFIFVDEETGFPYVEKVKGVNVSPLRDLRDTLRKELMMRVAKKQPVPLYGFVVEMKAIKIQGKKGQYYIHDFSQPEVLEDPTRFGPVFQALVVNRGADLADDGSDDAVEAGEPTGGAAVSQAVEGEYIEA